MRKLSKGAMNERHANASGSLANGQNADVPWVQREELTCRTMKESGGWTA
jgi:hypothetical protein